MSRILQSFRIAHISKQFTSSNTILSNRLCTSSDDEKSAKKNSAKEKSAQKSSKPKNETVNRLNALLQQFIVADQKTKHDKLSLAKPTPKNLKLEPGVKFAKVETVENKIVAAIKDVADAVGGNKAQTESELLNRLMNGDEKIPSTNLSDIVRGMKIDREAKSEGIASKANKVRKLMETNEQQAAPKQRTRPNRPQRQFPIEAANVEPIDIFGVEPLGFFTNTELKPEENKMNKTWDELYARELKLAVTHPPLNYFQEQILWTEQGKIWKFPIDNEQGMEKEQSVYFTEHVFLEEHLASWCPERGPLRHFMELVCVGLSKNPYMSVEDKKEHIKWFENYFEEKKKLLQETGAIVDEVAAKKQIENQ